MMKASKAIFALFAVMAMTVSSFAVMEERADAADLIATAPLPEPKEYMYAITTDSGNSLITKVRASVDGSPLEQISAARNESTAGASSISDFWAFDRTTGMGPFNSFYAAVNVTEGSGTDNGEAQRCTEAGTIAFILDPYDLSKTLNGTELTGAYNIMLIVPTVYWKATATNLYLSSAPRYTAGTSTVSGMVAYAHSAGDGKTFRNVFPYIGIGVYEASVSDGRMMSASGVLPKASATNDQFKSYADALTPAPGSDYQQWNFYQWTLYKMMAYTVMGTKNSQAMLGDGPVNSTATRSSMTGLADAAGPYADSTSSYSKLFIENSWGSLSEFVGDARFYDRVLYTGNALGGASIAGSQEMVPGAALPSEGMIRTTYPDSEVWDLPKSSRIANPGLSGIGDQTWVYNGACSMVVGGCWLDGEGAGIADLAGPYGLSYAYSNYGSRLAYVMAADAVSSDFEAGGVVYRAAPGSAAKVIGYAGSPSSVSIPSSVVHDGEEHAVTSVGDKAFYGCESLVSVDLGHAKAVGMKAFANCSSLQDVDLGDSLRTIGPYAFYGCADMSGLRVPSALRSVGAEAFRGVTILDSDGVFVLPSDASVLRGQSFSGSDGILVRDPGSGEPFEADVGVGQRLIVDGLVYTVTSLEPLEASLTGYASAPQELAVPAAVCFKDREYSVVSIGERAFYGCPSLVSADLGSVSSVGSRAFANCAGLSSLSVPGTVSSIGAYAFYGCAALESLAVPGEGVAVSASAFRECTGLTSASFTGSGASIGDKAFYGCSGLASLDLSGVSAIGLKAFSYSDGVEELVVSGTVSSVGGYAFYGCAALSRVVIEDGVASIGNSAFSECRSIASLEVGGDLESLGANAFYRYAFRDADGGAMAPTAESLRGHAFAGSSMVLDMLR